MREKGRSRRREIKGCVCMRERSECVREGRERGIMFRACLYYLLTRARGKGARRKPLQRPTVPQESGTRAKGHF